MQETNHNDEPLNAGLTKKEPRMKARSIESVKVRVRALEIFRQRTIRVGIFGTWLLEYLAHDLFGSGTEGEKCWRSSFQR